MKIRLPLPPRFAFALVPVGALLAFAGIRRWRRRRNLRHQPAQVANMQAEHDALRRELDQLCTDMEGGETLRRMWTEFRDHLRRHHEAEANDLWPMLRSHLGDPAEERHLDAMVDEDHTLDKEIDLVDEAFSSPEGDSGRLINLLARSVRDHLEHEERSIVPLLERHLSQAEWRSYLIAERKQTPLRQRVVHPQRVPA